ncbi:NAD(P)-dependent oxidoreductase [Verminephrobacter eiseniae]|uniref:6-phosphogluconate dehydrogenase, NAD-binding n=1 Tax=Verminephrobacter eiseniae (strain EF01-2) TaxID=391735 RepID=A1WHT5_VEREI|nr:NAD(P)-dependent oxidoreductase [Verminephrobacter eiseniae]ABM57192.1 6-phosphogluconate dehydrogenase, NAD-binding [Verminephrobacter eiseniae EF01-2]MCW5282820.1 NAD(P)-dependent oxidoreductase [Verminephrobacter eiseniae]MCW5303136.1 NAD(P)-dependent oxidoreductase [Verminephrobacter eiseniae]MCW8181349.1 NAD(P)-dependent oxidoreductase [Verminephrobacter eiseniae]MCW8192617.1 NAD(P)-dependent oxidoreductase [Verminephrobacter eiseniae]
MKIGLVGLGNIGVHLGTRLLAAGHELLVHDRNDTMQQRLVAKGATGVGNAKELASQTEIVLLCLPMPRIVADVASEVAQGCAVRIVVDLSTTGPSVTKEVEALLKARDIALIGAPVSGGTVAAEKGTLAVMPAGSEAAYREVEALLRVIGKSIFYLGADPSLGQTMKIINNTLYATSMVASCEALVYGVKAGLDSKTMLDVINVSSGRSFATLERIPQCALDRSFPIRFTTELLHKDIKMCIDEAEKIGAPMLVSPAARQFLAFAITQGDAQQDNVYPIRHFEGWAGVQFGEAGNKA